MFTRSRRKLLKEFNESQNFSSDSSEEEIAVTANNSVEKMAEHQEEVFTSVIPKSFGGTTSESVEEFIKNFTRAAKANRWTEETKLLQLPCYLEGSALDYFETVEGQCENFEAAVQKLKFAFKSSVESERNYFKLLNRKQRRNEDLWTFFNDVLKLCYNSNQEMSDPEKVGFIIRGLQPKILEKVNLMDNSTLEKLRKNLQKIEATECMIGECSSDGIWSTSRENKSRPDNPDEMEQLRQRIQQLEKNTNRFVRSNYVNYKDKIWNKQKAIKNETRTPDGRVICFECGKPGHYAKSCYSKNFTSKNSTPRR